MYRKSFSQPHIHQQYTYTTTNMFTTTTPTTMILNNFDSVGFETFSNNSDHQDKSSGTCTGSSWERELAELQNGHSTKNQKKVPHKKKRPASLKSCVNPNCHHQMGCKAKKCKLCKTQQPYKFTKSTKPKSVNKGYGNGKLECTSCSAKWGTRKLCCDCGAKNIWDKKKTLKNTKKRPRSIPNVSAVHKKAPKRQRCDSFEELMSKTSRPNSRPRGDSLVLIEPARPRGDSLVLIEPARPRGDSLDMNDEEFEHFWTDPGTKRLRFDSFELMTDEKQRFDSFELMSNEELSKLL